MMDSHRYGMILGIGFYLLHVTNCSKLSHRADGNQIWQLQILTRHGGFVDVMVKLLSIDDGYSLIWDAME